MNFKLPAFAAAFSLLTSAAFAGAGDYAFEPVVAEVPHGPGGDLAVRLVHKPSGKPIDKAVIFRTRLDMAPENMAAMTAAVVPAPSTEPGIYRFKADLDMAGKWALHLMAKVQGETETIEGTVLFTAN